MAIDVSFKRACMDMDAMHRILCDHIRTLNIDNLKIETLLANEIEKCEIWRKEIMGYLADIVQKFTDGEHQQHKVWVKKTAYWQMIQEAPFCRRIIKKPQGYAGDALLMEQIYRNEFEGETLLAKFFHKQAVSSHACRAVRNRAVYLKEHIQKTKGCRILSVAAGLVKEIRHFLSKYDSPNAYHFMALDHDLNTIQNARSLIRDNRVRYGLADVFQFIKGNMSVAVPAEYDSYSDNGCDKRLWPLPGGPGSFQSVQLEPESFDLVYSAGLFDYIQTFPHNPRRGAVALTKRLFDLVAPGGKLIIGNFSPQNPKDNRYIMEYIYDWSLIYRNREQVLRFADTIAPDQIDDIIVEHEPLGINLFLVITKRANPYWG